jgi:hypothetical protein
MIGDVIIVAFVIWIIFLGGAERMENTVFGYFTQGPAAEKAIYIKILVSPLLAWAAYDLFF